VNTWQISEDHFDPKKLHVQETVYTIGNGYFGTRGSFEEGYLGASPATLLYGVFDNIPIGKEELANAPDWLPIKLFVNGERFRLGKGKILAYHRVLDMQNGVLSRTVRWESQKGIRLRITSERFASLADENVGAIRYSVTAEEQSAAKGKLDLILRATINTAVGNNDLMHWESVDEGHEDDVVWLQSQTRKSEVQLVQAMSFTTQAQGFSKHIFDSDIAPSIEFQGKLALGETFTAEKIVVMYTSRDVEAPRQAALNHLTHLMQSSQNSVYEELLAEHVDAWQHYWQTSDIIIEGDDKAQQAIRYNVYQLRISASPDDSRYSIAAKGLTGFGYRGHIFHDTEIFMLPFFTYVHPDMARTLLLYRYHLLPAARAKAKHNGYEGAQFPWESTLDGLEATPETIIHPESGELIPVLNGHIELHITASIAFANWQYWYVSGDDAYMREYGAEILLSTAQFWASRAQYSPEHHDYEINNVIGPDEWHEHVNNNAYTNYMARWNIQTAIDVLDWLHTYAREKAEDLTKKLNLTDNLLEHWRDVIARMRIPQDKRTGLFEQFDGFFKLEPLNQEKYKGRSASYQAILGMEPVQHYQIVKQADVLMLLTLLNQQFDLHTKRVNWDYYYPITDHDFGSSLTPALHVILACELGHIDTAYDLFMKGALVDLENLRLNTAEGIHDACCGAVWQAAILGFAGLCLTEDSYTTTPNFPDGWTRLAFTFLHKGQPTLDELHRS
jgi:trehalose/maltose hydrolase-like predicted phosphorylase